MHQRIKLAVNNKIIQQINYFNFLECNISYIRNEDPFTEIRKYQHSCGQLREGRARKHTIIKNYTTRWQSLIYSAETWSLTSEQLKRIEPSVQNLRAISGYTLRDKKKRRELKTSKLSDKNTKQTWSNK